METLVGDNYLAYDPIEKNTSFYLATPLMVFEDNSEDDLSILENFFEPKDGDDPMIKILKSTIKNMLTTMPLNDIVGSMDTGHEGQRKIIAELFPMDKDNPTFFDMVKTMSEFTLKIFADSNLYKDLRNMIYTGVNNGKMTLDENLDFNEALKETIIQKSYLEFVSESIKVRGQGEVPYYDLYLMAYNMLDIFGIKKDKITAKNSLVNLHNDGMHTFFAQYCDYYVTDDATTTLKCQALYKLFGIETKVISVDAFIRLLPEIFSDFDEDREWFSRKLIFDLQNSSYRAPEFLDNKSVQRMEKHCMYLDFFDAIVKIDDGSRTELVIFKGYSHQLSNPSWSEQAQIIDRALAIFGGDIDSKGRFEYKDHNRNLSDELVSRKWEQGNLTFELRPYEMINNNYALIITFPQSIGE
ncbi:hypothetical protein [Mucilaginibacter flavus]|uniref:hypothetical protein n=1 Tax=Mucilaginibacter flavus TaxID=931504 RepID=UPI0025B3F814|nr:hypothetical protein [Mucilaginibacter flavus]MDN3581368.1 hypothetical protein [Mucilaginibacter flavus]